MTEPADREGVVTAEQRDVPGNVPLYDVLAAMPGTRELLAKVEAERDAALDVVERVKALHRKAPTLDQCLYDGLIWPCRTIRVIDSPTASEAHNG